jgi:hypothetical protein
MSQYPKGIVAMIIRTYARGTRAAVPLLLAALAAACVDESYPLEPGPPVEARASADLGAAAASAAVAVQDAIDRIAPGLEAKTASGLMPELREAAAALAAGDTYAARFALDRAEHALGRQDADVPNPDSDAIRLAIDIARSIIDRR